VTAAWYEDPRWRRRLLAEQELMRARFPQFVLKRGRAGELYWRGAVEPVPRAVFIVRVVYPATYPFVEPTLRVDTPPLRAGAPHVYADGSLCVHRRQWDPTRGTAPSLVPVLCGWLFMYERWRLHGEVF
jgi:ubiquitin-protein ligase